MSAKWGVCIFGGGQALARWGFFFFSFFAKCVCVSLSVYDSRLDEVRAEERKPALVGCSRIPLPGPPPLVSLVGTNKRVDKATLTLTQPSSPLLNFHCMFGYPKTWLGPRVTALEMEDYGERSVMFSVYGVSPGSRLTIST